jgi:hypothetical protein
MPDFKTVDIPQGTFIGWGKKGQTVTVKTLSFDPIGGSDFNRNPCPQLVGTLVEACDNYKDKGTAHETLAAGELVTVTAGQANLKRGLMAADPKPGDLVRMTYTDTYKTAQGEGKVIQVEIAPGTPDAVTADDI